jgi:phosphohistidine phosphatase
MAGSSGRRLILLRHAKSAWPEVPDHERPLAPRGQRDAPAAGRWLRKAGCVPDRVLCSTARRARETWSLAEDKLHAQPQVVLEERVYGASTAELVDLARATPAQVRTLLIVGHDPAMRGLTLELAGADPDPDADTAASAGAQPGLLDLVRAKFPTAAIAVLAFTGTWPQLAPGHARLADFVTPGDYRSGGDKS